MTAGEQPPGQEQPSRRRSLRYRVQTPLDVTVLRSGIPDTLPGRSVNLGEGGVAAVLAGELSPGEAVGVEISLPLVTGLLRTRALVRHQDKLRSGRIRRLRSRPPPGRIRKAVDWALERAIFRPLPRILQSTSGEGGRGFCCWPSPQCWLHCSGGVGIGDGKIWNRVCGMKRLPLASSLKLMFPPM
jgi:hypothetical protein